MNKNQSIYYLQVLKKIKHNNGTLNLSSSSQDMKYEERKNSRNCHTVLNIDVKKMQRKLKEIASW